MQTQTFGETQEHLKITEGFNLFYRHWPSAGPAEKAVVFLHGIESAWWNWLESKLHSKSFI
jgi:alpha-beta hydrolase superfamily lysophospholipase